MKENIDNKILKEKKMIINPKELLNLCNLISLYNLFYIKLSLLSR